MSIPRLSAGDLVGVTCLFVLFVRVRSADRVRLSHSLTRLFNHLPLGGEPGPAVVLFNTKGARSSARDFHLFVCRGGLFGPRVLHTAQLLARAAAIALDKQKGHNRVVAQAAVRSAPQPLTCSSNGESSLASGPSSPPHLSSPSSSVSSRQGADKGERSDVKLDQASGSARPVKALKQISSGTASSRAPCDSLACELSAHQLPQRAATATTPTRKRAARARLPHTPPKAYAHSAGYEWMSTEPIMTIESLPSDQSTGAFESSAFEDALYSHQCLQASYAARVAKQAHGAQVQSQTATSMTSLTYKRERHVSAHDEQKNVGRTANAVKLAGDGSVDHRLASHGPLRIISVNSVPRDSLATSSNKLAGVACLSLMSPKCTTAPTTTLAPSHIATAPAPAPAANAEQQPSRSLAHELTQVLADDAAHTLPAGSITAIYPDIAPESSAPAAQAVALAFALHGSHKSKQAARPQPSMKPYDHCAFPARLVREEVQYTDVKIAPGFTFTTGTIGLSRSRSLPRCVGGRRSSWSCARRRRCAGCRCERGEGRRVS